MQMLTLDGIVSAHMVSVVGGIFCFFFVVVFTILISENKCAPSPWAVEQNSAPLEWKWMVPTPPSFNTFEELPAILRRPICPNH